MKNNGGLPKHHSRHTRTLLVQGSHGFVRQFKGILIGQHGHNYEREGGRERQREREREREREHAERDR